MKNGAKKFFKGAIITALSQIIIFTIVFVPLYASKIREAPMTFGEAYGISFWALKEIIGIFILVAMITGGLREWLRVDAR